MGEKTAITWCHHTFNAWWGCSKVSPECDNCYAERDSKRYGFRLWGPESARRFFTDKHWNEPLRWNAAAEAAGERRRVFTNSMADVFEDRPDLIPHRERLWRLIDATPNLDWLLLTKRIENAQSMFPVWREHWWDNVWLGVSAGTQRTADIWIPKLLPYRASFPVLWVSAEPLLEEVDFSKPLGDPDGADATIVDWIVVGGESGPRYRPMSLDWARKVLAYCADTDTPFFFKQVGGFRPKDNGDLLDGREIKQFPQ